MKVYKLEYSYDMFMDGRVASGVHLFSSLDKLYKFCELQYGKKKEDFTDGCVCYNDVGEWDTECWYISEVVLDKDLEMLLEELENNGKEDVI